MPRTYMYIYSLTCSTCTEYEHAMMYIDASHARMYIDALHAMLHVWMIHLPCWQYFSRRGTPLDGDGSGILLSRWWTWIILYLEKIFGATIYCNPRNVFRFFKHDESAVIYILITLLNFYHSQVYAHMWSSLCNSTMVIAMELSELPNYKVWLPTRVFLECSTLERSASGVLFLKVYIVCGCLLCFCITRTLECGLI